MNRIEKGKKGLSTFGIILIVLAVLTFALGVLGIVFGALNLKIGLIIAGVLGVLLCGFFIVYGVIFVWTSRALVATNGSIAEDNLGIGTVNQEKCQKCGMPLDPETKQCPNHKDEEKEVE